MSKFDNMGKVELRAACKKEGIVYGKLNNDGMRAALNKAHSVPPGGSLLDLAVDEAAKVGLTDFSKSIAATAPAVETNIGAPTAIEKGAASELKVRKPPKKAAERKVRASANGVTQPSSGTICGAIWAALDAKRTALKGETPTFEHLRELAKDAGWQKNTAMTQYQRWKQFNGLMPRSLTV